MKLNTKPLRFIKHLIYQGGEGRHVQGTGTPHLVFNDFIHSIVIIY
jgi:hypothetical protein